MDRSINPKITIITVVFNDVEHIERTICSVLDQTYSNIEYIVIDGGSTDGTVEVIKRYAGRLSLWVSEPDKGIYDAMNKGIKYATGEWINFMNSGDYFYSNGVLARIFSTSRLHDDLIYGSFVGNFNNQPVLCSAVPSVYDVAWKGMPLCHQALFTRASLMKEYIFDRTYHVSADGNFVSRCIKEGKKFSRVDEIIFRVGTLGYSDHNWFRARKENWLIARKFFPGYRTDLYHLQSMIRDVAFRTFKLITSTFGLYQLLRWTYRSTVRKFVPMLPKGVKPFRE